MNGNAPRYFVAIAEYQSLRAASEALHMSQSALSRQLLNLEEELGVKLLERLPRGISLTEAGKVFLRYARNSLENLEATLAEVDALQGTNSGIVRIAAQEAFMDVVLPECLAEFRSRFPDVRVAVELCVTREIVAKVQDGAVDFGLAFNPELSFDVSLHSSVPEEVVAVFAPEHPLAKMEELRLRDLVPYALALPLQKTATANLIHQAALADGLKLRGAVESSSIHMRLRMSEATNMVSVLARIAATSGVERGRLTTRPLCDQALQRGMITLFSSPGRALPMAAVTLQRVVTERLRLRARQKAA